MPPCGDPRPSATLRLILLVLAALCALPAAAVAAQSDPATTVRSVARVITDTDRYAPGTALRIALQITPAPGWHVYWHNPGDAGAAPEFTAIPGLNPGPIAWPLPRRIPDGPVMSFGYTDPVVLARPLTLAGPGPQALTIQADWLICEKLCVPESATLHLVLPQGAPAPAAEAALFPSVPGPSPWPARIAPDGTLSLVGVPPTDQAVFLPDRSDTTVLAAPQPMRQDGGALTLRLTPAAAFVAGAPMPGLLVLGQGAARRGYTLTAQPGPVTGDKTKPAPAPADAGAGIGAGTLLAALLGGLVLNLMPCVFPVLAMKTIGLASLTGSARRQVRLHALSYVGGVLLAFGLLAGLMLGLRAAGHAAGWGFQFQYPGFVAAMGWLCFALGLNLSGVWQLQAGWMGAGQALTVPRRSCRQPGHRAAGGGGGHPVHRAVHGCRAGGRAGGAGRRRTGGVP